MKTAGHLGTFRTGVALLLAVLGGAAAFWVVRSDREERAETPPPEASLRFPEKVLRAPPEIRELYEFAARRPDVLQYMPCFCGCWRAGHRSNYDCFVDQVRADGTVEIDDMGFT
jgi:hypothetical protein